MCISSSCCTTTGYIENCQKKMPGVELVTVFMRYRKGYKEISRFRLSGETNSGCNWTIPNDSKSRHPKPATTDHCYHENPNQVVCID